MQDFMGSFLPLCGLVALVIVAGLAAWKFFTLRSKGNAVIARRLPAKGTHGWRHGRVVCNGQQLNMYKLRSLSPSADVVLERKELTLRRRTIILNWLSILLRLWRLHPGWNLHQIAVKNARRQSHSNRVNNTLTVLAYCTLR